MCSFLSGVKRAGEAKKAGSDYLNLEKARWGRDDIAIKHLPRRRLFPVRSSGLIKESCFSWQFRPKVLWNSSLSNCFSLSLHTPLYSDRVRSVILSSSRKRIGRQIKYMACSLKWHGVRDFPACRYSPRGTSITVLFFYMIPGRKEVRTPEKSSIGCHRILPGFKGNLWRRKAIAWFILCCWSRVAVNQSYIKEQTGTWTSSGFNHCLRVFGWKP